MHDLTHRIEHGMQVYPGDPEVSVSPALVIDRDGVAVTELRLGSHTGTHLDAPAHTVIGGRTMADVELAELVGDALVLHVGPLHERETYDLGTLRSAGPAGRGGAPPGRLPPIVLIDTGWARHFGTERALQHPALSARAARELLDRGMRVLGVDTLSPDPTSRDGATEFPVHEAVLGADGLIVENLTGLDRLPTLTRVGFFPLRLDGDGAPVRAVAFDA